MSKRIIIDGRMYGESGIGRYIRNLISSLQHIDQENEYIILHLKKDYDTLVYHNNFHKVLTNFRWYGVEEQMKLPLLLGSFKPDLVHFPHFNVPVLYKGRYVVTIHDLIHQHFSMKRATTHGNLVYKLKQLGYKKVFNTAVSRSEKIFVPSDFVKRQLIDKWKINISKIVVTHEAVDDKILTIINKINKRKSAVFIEKSGIRQPYIFYVGNAHPHKNVEGLIKAFSKLKKKYPDLSLVLSGNDHYFWQRIKKEITQEGVIYTGYVTDEELVGLYQNADCFVLPSFEEGFGIPILEAMACGCPVVSSRAGSLPEIGADACLYFDPSNIDNMIEKMSQLLADKKLRQQLRKKGVKICQKFSWKTLAQKTLKVYLQTIDL